jgi:hypothetical protein
VLYTVSRERPVHQIVQTLTGFATRLFIGDPCRSSNAITRNAIIAANDIDNVDGLFSDAV